MSTFSVAQAKSHLSELIDRALRGEGVVITRHGTPVVEVRSLRPAATVLSPGDLAWLDAVRLRPAKSLSEDAATLVSRMRDEEWR